MQGRINQFIDQRTTMLAGVSHDLKTPLTRMKLELELMPDGQHKDAMRKDIEDMEQMIAGYLSFAKGDGDEDVQRVSLKSILDKTIEDAIRLSLKVQDNRINDEDVLVWGRPMAMARAFDNFISNAARYADTIHIDAYVQEEKAIVTIEDNGPGVDEKDMAEVIKPFVRADKSRNTKTGGVGLGLTIANDTITAQGGEMTLSKSETLGGLKVTVTLPL